MSAEIPAGATAARWFDRTTPPHILTLVLIAGIAALNMNIFLPSLPSMAAYFGADYALVQLAVSAYLGVTAVMQLLVGPLSDRFGRRPVMLGGMVVFLLATLGCILSQDIYVFLTFRMIQASVATGMVLSRAIVRDMVEPHKAASMLGYVTMGMALVPMVGPMIGGYLDEWFGWQASFTFTGVFGLIVFCVVWADMGETNTSRSASFSTQFRAYPELLASRRFWGYALVAAFASGAFFAFLGGGPFVSTVVLGMDPGEMGIYFGLIAFGYLMGNYLSGRYSERFKINRMILAGSIVASLATLLGIALFAAGFKHPLTLFGSILLVGVGNGLTLPSANAGIVSVRPELAGSASGLGGALMIGGGAVLSAITGAILTESNGAYLLLAMMFLSSVLGVLVSVYVIHRSKVVGAEG